MRWQVKQGANKTNNGLAVALPFDNEFELFAAAGQARAILLAQVIALKCCGCAD